MTEIGKSRKRVEDNRFIRGKGNYTDDIVLPGMLHMEILRSPLAHARIKSIDTSRAWQIPGVHLVLTGEMMATRNLTARHAIGSSRRERNERWMAGERRASRGRRRDERIVAANGRVAASPSCASATP